MFQRRVLESKVDLNGHERGVGVCSTHLASEHAYMSFVSGDSLEMTEDRRSVVRVVRYNGPADVDEQKEKIFGLLWS